MAIKKKQNFQEETVESISSMSGRQHPRLRTAEGWKRSLLRKSRTSRGASKS